MTYATIGKREQRVSQLMFLRLLAARPGVSARGADAVGRGLQDRGRPGRARGSRAARRVSPDPLQEGAGGRHPVAGDDGFVAIETTRPELIPACVALVAHPDDERYQPLFGTEVVTPLFGVRVPVLAHRAGRPREGQRHRDDLHVRRHHRRHLVARAEAAGARDRAAQRHARPGDVGRRRDGSPTDAARAQAGLRRSWRACRRRRRRRRSPSC